MISDGHTTREALAYLRPVTDVFRVDLKALDERGYRALGGSLAPVLDAILEARALGYWVEVVTLVVPGFNDDLGALREAARALAVVDPAMPWHLNAYQPRYKLAATTPRAPSITMVSAAGMALARALSILDDTLIPSARNAEFRTFLQTVRASVQRHLTRARQIQSDAGA